MSSPPGDRFSEVFSALSLVSCDRSRFWLIVERLITIENKNLTEIGSIILIAVVRQQFVYNGHQLLDFPVPELVQSQSTFTTDPEVLQNWAGFTLCSSPGQAVGDCAAVMRFTPCMLCVQIAVNSA